MALVGFMVLHKLKLPKFKILSTHVVILVINALDYQNSAMVFFFFGSVKGKIIGYVG